MVETAVGDETGRCDRIGAVIHSVPGASLPLGKTFNPDARTKKVLEGAARKAHAWLELKYETAFAPYNEGQSTSYAKHDIYPIDARGLTYSFGFVGIKHLGARQFYLMTIKDKKGRALGGRRSYRLTVPAKAPVQQYWSATAYDRETHAFIRNMERFSRSSQNPELQTNADGSVDVYFGPKGPKGKESNWIPTSTKGEFKVLFRLYGPEKPLFDKSWVLPDIEKIN